MKKQRWWYVVGTWALWWAAITAAFWFLGTALDRPTGLAGCAASAALVIVVGEAGDRLRRCLSRRREPG